jgi:Holliday junction resolvasome RuvABC ATP-dependent DNA helicase subunit
LKDTNAARTGAASSAYQSIQGTVAQIVRHVCGDRIRASADSPAADTPLADSPQPRPNTDLVPEPSVTTAVPPERERSGAVDRESQQGTALDSGSGVREKIRRAHDVFDQAFSDFIGNTQAIEKLRDDLVDALVKQPPHLASAYLLTGNPSTGKTTLANKVAALLAVTFVKLVGTNIRSESDLIEQVDKAFKAAGKAPIVTKAGKQGIPEHEYPECLIFIDEIHLVKGRAQEGLLTLTEPKDRYVRLRDRICLFPRATYMAATTRDSEIDRALRTRFGNPIHLNDYTVAEVARMLFVKKEVWANWPEQVRSGIAQLARCIPREAERLAQKLDRKMAVSREPLTLEVALEKLRLEEGLDRHGLDQLCWDTLRLLAKQSRPVGRETLAQQLRSADEEKLTSEIIPGLQALGLVEQVAGGQTITDRGRNYLRNEAPPSSR